jgi:hypothetical protein
MELDYSATRNAFKNMRSSFANLIHQFDASIAYRVVEYCMAYDISVLHVVND